jgi:hypothetical protein
VDGHPCPVICLAIKWGSTTVSWLLLEMERILMPKSGIGINTPL